MALLGQRQHRSVQRIALHPIKVVGRYASLNPNVYVTTNPTPAADVDHNAHACRGIECPKCYPANHSDPPTLTSIQ